MKFIGLLLYFSTVFAQVDSNLLSDQTLKRFKKVPEFEFIIQEANKLGVKVYLFGGTASAFAHYVRWDLEREAGDDKYQTERFDYDFTNIYRGNQDLDIVVDGTPEQADQLQNILQETYPHFVGDREAWEVRLLRESRGNKRALLGDEDFRKQHSDTNSTGMILLNPNQNNIIYNDLLNWGSQDSDFLNDVAAAKIKFLFSVEHEKTERYKEGRNPPALAAIRYLAKLAQYEIKGTKEDLVIVTKIIQETDFKKLSTYGKKKAEEFALKTLLNAPNSEYAWNLLEKTGTRQKLIVMDGNRLKEEESLSWWMNKEPLRSFEFGTEGKTALEIFGKDNLIVSHETNSFQAYENITRSSRGEANAFISRQKINGEAAVHGNGFYTRIGEEGAAGTGLTIRFKLHPLARENKDFFTKNDFVIVTNKNALTLIQENLNLSMLDFLKLIKMDDITEQDGGLLEKFNRKFNRQRSNSSEFAEAVAMVKEQILLSDYNFIDVDLIEFKDFSDLSRFYSFLHSSDAVVTLSLLAKKIKFRFDWIEKLIAEGDFSVFRVILQDILEKLDSPEDKISLVKKVLDQIPDPVIPRDKPIGVKIQTEIEKEHVFNLTTEFLQKNSLSSEWVTEKFFKNKSCTVLNYYIKNVVAQSFFKGDLEEHILRFLDKCHDLNSLTRITKSGILESTSQISEKLLIKLVHLHIKNIVPSEAFQNKSKLEPLLLEVLEKKNKKGFHFLIQHLIEHILPYYSVRSNLHLIEKFTDEFLAIQGDTGVKLRTLFVQNIFKFPDLHSWLIKTQFLEKYYESGVATEVLIASVLQRPHWNDGKLMSKMLQDHMSGKGNTIKQYIKHEKWWIYPDLFSVFILSKALREKRVSGSRVPNLKFEHGQLVKVFKHKNWKRWPKVLKTILDFPEEHIFNQWEVDKILLDHYWSSHIDLMKTYTHHYEDIDNFTLVLGQKKWAGEIDLLKAFLIRQRAAPDWEGLKENVLSQPQWFNHPNYLNWMSHLDKDPDLKNHHKSGLRSIFQQINRSRQCSNILL